MVQGNRHLKNLARERSEASNTSYSTELSVLNSNVAEQRRNIPKGFESWLPLFDSLGYGWKCKVMRNYITDEQQLTIYYDKYTFGHNITPGIILAESLGKTDHRLRYLPKQFGEKDLVILFEETACTNPIVTKGKTEEQLAKAVAKLANKVAFEVAEGKPSTVYGDPDAGPEDGIIWDEETLRGKIFVDGEYVESTNPEWVPVDLD